MSSADEARLVLFLQRNNDKLHRAAQDRAYRLAWGDPAVCGDDVYARAVERAWRKWAELPVGWDDDRRRAWLIRIMTNVAREDLRAAARRNDAQVSLQGIHIVEVQRSAATADPTCRAVEARDVVARLLPAALEALPDTSRELWLMTRSGAASDQAIAAELGIAASSVRSRLCRITSTLLDRLGPDVIALLDHPHAGGASA